MSGSIVELTSSVAAAIVVTLAVNAFVRRIMARRPMDTAGVAKHVVARPHPRRSGTGDGERTIAMKVLLVTLDLFGPPGGIARHCRLVLKALTEDPRVQAVDVVALLDDPDSIPDPRYFGERARVVRGVRRRPAAAGAAGAARGALAMRTTWCWPATSTSLRCCGQRRYARADRSA